jgi:hypothetical protein
MSRIVRIICDLIELSQVGGLNEPTQIDARGLGGWGAGLFVFGSQLGATMSSIAFSMTGE